MAKTKLTFEQLAEFIHSDYTLEVFPDIVYPFETRFKKPRIAWLADTLEKRYNEFLANPNNDADDDIDPPPGEVE